MLGSLTSASFLTQIKGVISSGKSTAESAVPILSVAVTTGLEYGMEDGIFVCPNEDYYLYSALFFIGPCVPLYFVSLLLTREFNRTLSGFCGFWRIHGFRKNRLKRRCRYFLQHMFISIIKCMLAPATWFILVLLKKKIYVCSQVGPLRSYKGNNTSYHLAVSTASTESQIYGWALLIFGVTSGCVVYFLKQCCVIKRKKLDCVELDPLDTYSAYEADKARDYFEIVIKKAALLNGEAKVNTLLGVTSKIIQSNNEVENTTDITTEKERNQKEEKHISFENIMEARSQMMQIYPRLCNPLDDSLPWYDHNWWKKLEAISSEKTYDNKTFESEEKENHSSKSLMNNFTDYW